MLLGHAALLQHCAHLLLGHGGRLGGLVRLALLHALTQLLVYRLHHLQAAIIGQAVAEQGLEDLLLLRGGHGRAVVKDGIHELLVALGSVAGIVLGAVDVRTAVLVGREQKAQLRRGHHPVQIALVEALVLAAIAQRRAAELHRADGADDVGEGILGVFVGLVFILGLEGDVVGVVHQQDQVVALDLQTLDHPLEELLHRLIHLQVRVAQRREQPVRVAVHHLIRAERDLHQVLARRAGEHLAEQRQILLRLLLRQGQQRVTEAGDDLPLLVHVAAEDAVDAVLVGVEPSANFGNFLSVHIFMPFGYSMEVTLRIIITCPSRTGFEEFKTFSLHTRRASAPFDKNTA